MSNISLVNHVASKLGSLRNKFVFVGGSIIELLLDREYPLEPRVTYDVDAIVQVCGYGAFSEIEQLLREQGFKNNLNDNVICRWQIDGINMDVMPTDKEILGFGNIWYEHAVKNAKKHVLATGQDILLITPPYFLATKIEAFENRGEQDFLGSHDLEDIVTVLDGRESLFSEIATSESDLQSYLIEKCNGYLRNPYFINSLPGHLSPYQTGIEERAERVERLVRKIADIETVI